ncbi:MAG: rhomboid family intramembrane serine protease [Bacteroidetes bacterium]|nr:MAG: rhomboid family intramembrane serine protease [Bacteroidota bacterium]
MSSNQYTPSGFRLLPPVVKNLLIINGLFYLATLTFESTFHIDLVRFLGLHYFQSEYFQPYQYVSYMFLHADFWHIFFNMFSLWMFGSLLENVWGPKRFLTFYMITGIGAALIQTLVNWWDFSSLQQEALLYADQPTLDTFVGFVKQNFPNYYDYHDTIRAFISQWTLNPANPGYASQSVDYVNQLIQMQMNIPTIGASGAVFGILLAFGMLFPNMLVYIYFLIPVKAKWIVIILGAIEIFSGISRNPSDNVAHFAHLGGMLFGFFLILYWRKKQFSN